ncbi:MAG TPA: ammonium transporter [Myxococcaceae bacterium]|nr:ammonium transporter [Myxococcaceae bacterium]
MEAKVALDTLWVVVAAALVFFMNAGFALLEAGLCRSKNTANILGKNVLVFCLAVLAYWAVGYGLMFGGLGGLFVDGSEPSPASVPVLAFFLFQACFAATACSIVSGAVAERIKYGAFLGVAFLLALGVYPVVGRWVWGGGFLAEWGFHDFAGSLVVHAFGGFAALAGVVLLGPREGRYGKDGRPRPIPGHSMPLATLGAFILWLGWFGFNAGSVLAVDESVPRIALVTTLAAAAGGVSATLAAWWRLKKPDLTMSLNGVLGGLVAITAGCAVLQPAAGVLVGLLAGVLVVFAVPAFDRVKLDDPVGALSVHLVNGVFGTLAVGLFAAPALRLGPDGAQLPYGLAHGGGLGLLGVQAAGVAVVGAFTLAVSGALWLAVKKTVGLRVSAEEEHHGLDITEMGLEAYASEPRGARRVEPEQRPVGALARPAPVTAEE